MPYSTRSIVRAVDAVATTPVKAGTDAHMQVLIGPEDGAPNFAMRRFRMGPGGGVPLHTNAVEHEQYVLGGRACVTIGESKHEVQAGMVLLIPAGVPHSYSVLDAPFEFLCMVPNLPDQIRLIRGGQ